MKTIVKISAKVLTICLMLGVFTTAHAQRYSSEYNTSKNRIERIQFQLDELELQDTYAMTKREKKAWKRKRRKLRAQLKDAQYDQWRYIRSTNPYARSRYYGPYTYNRSYSPYFYRPAPRRVYVVRRGR